MFLLLLLVLPGCCQVFLQWCELMKGLTYQEPSVGWWSHSRARGPLKVAFCRGSPASEQPESIFWYLSAPFPGTDTVV